MFECGQCFRWNRDSDGKYYGVVKGIAAKVWTEDGKACISGSGKDFENVWYDYFDLSRDYSVARRAVSSDPFTSAAAEFGRGIRILHQDKWEALCSFIISQCNNIPRIKKIIETLCMLFGNEISFEGKTYYSFPTAERVAALSETDLASLRCGYRAPYIIGAARAVASGEIELEALSHASCAEAVATLKKLKGIGDKVANCTVLFGLCIPEAFPVDVWMKKALRAHYPAGFDPKVFGENAGLAQQYIFYYARTGNV